MREPQIPKITLIGLSGGIDSVHFLYDLLENTDDVVIAHHVHLINQEGRHRAEDQSCKEIIRYLHENCRPFHTSDSAVNRKRFKVFGADTITVSFELGFAATNFMVETGHMPRRWSLGFCAEELEELGPENNPRKPYLLAAMSAATWPNKPPEYFRPKIKPKTELMREMGKELCDLCWTCRRPVQRDDGGFDECGECKTCNLMAKCRAELEADGW